MTGAMTNSMSDRQTSRIDTNQTSITALIDARATLDFIRCRISRIARLQLEVGRLNTNDTAELQALFAAEHVAENDLSALLTARKTTH